MPRDTRILQPFRIELQGVAEPQFNECVGLLSSVEASG
jgi:hypothetical protein